MKSGSGKVVYLCPKCRSPHIYGPQKFIPLSFYDNGMLLSYVAQKSGSCSDCLTWWPWSSRIKISTSKYVKEPETKTIFQKFMAFIKKRKICVVRWFIG